MTDTATAGPLVIGYGNPLRGDDALGWRAALALTADPRLAGVDILARHQLTPELAVDIAAASRVVFIDSRDARGALPAGRDPGTVSVCAIAPEAPTMAWTHHLGAAELLGWAAELYGNAPPAVLVTAPAVCFDLSAHLSAGGEQVLVSLVDVVAALLGEGDGDA